MSSYQNQSQRWVVIWCVKHEEIMEMINHTELLPLRIAGISERNKKSR